MLSFDELSADLDNPFDSADPQAELLIEAVELAYHEGEIAQAIAALSPAQRKYVHLRFWRGLSHSEMAPHFGYVPNALWSSKRNGARGKLAESLAHLANAA